MVSTGEGEGLLAGDRVALLVPGSPAYVDLVLALLADGVFPVPLDPALTRQSATASSSRSLPTWS